MILNNRRLIHSLIPLCFTFVAGLAWSAASAAPKAPAVRGDMLVNATQLASLLGAPGVKVLHVGRKRDAYDAGHIPGALFVGWDEITETVGGLPNEIPPLPKLTALMRRLGVMADDRIILYDDEAGVAAARAYVTLDYLGLGERTAVLNGQLKKWVAEGRPLSKEAPKVTPSKFTPKPNPSVIADFKTVQAISSKNGELSAQGERLVDARPAEQYQGTQAGEGIERPGHIPGAVSVPWSCGVESEANPVFRPPAELRAELDKAGVKPGEKVITYCRTGGQASFAYFMLKYLGYDVKMYDGSYHEWSHKPGTAVAK